MAGESQRVQILTAPLDIHHGAGAVLFRLVGAVDAVSAAELAERLERYRDGSQRHLVLDLTSLRTLSVTGARVLAECAQRLAEQNRRVLIAGAAESVAETLRATPSMEHIALCPSLDAALTSLQPPPGGPPSPCLPPVRPDQAGLRNLRAQARTRPLIGLVQGILQERYGLTDLETAFALLAETSQRHNVPLRVLAAAVATAPPRPAERWFPGRTMAPPPDAPFFGRDRDDVKNRGAVLKAILGRALEIAGTEHADLQLVDPALDVLVLEKQQGFSAGFLDFFAEVGADGTACAVARRTRTLVSVADVATDPIFAGRASREVLLAAGSRTVHSIPFLDAAGRCVGMVSTHHPRRGRHLTAGEQAALERLAHEAAGWLTWHHRAVVRDALRYLHHLAGTR